MRHLIAKTIRGLVEFGLSVKTAGYRCQITSYMPDLDQERGLSATVAKGTVIPLQQHVGNDFGRAFAGLFVVVSQPGLGKMISR